MTAPSNVAQHVRRTNRESQAAFEASSESSSIRSIAKVSFAALSVLAILTGAGGYVVAAIVVKASFQVSVMAAIMSGSLALLTAFAIRSCCHSKSVKPKEISQKKQKMDASSKSAKETPKTNLPRNSVKKTPKKNPSTNSTNEKQKTNLPSKSLKESEGDKVTKTTYGNSLCGCLGIDTIQNLPKVEVNSITFEDSSNYSENFPKYLTVIRKSILGEHQVAKATMTKPNRAIIAIKIELLDPQTQALNAVAEIIFTYFSEWGNTSYQIASPNLTGNDTTCIQGPANPKLLAAAKNLLQGKTISFPLVKTVFTRYHIRMAK